MNGFVKILLCTLLLITSSGLSDCTNVSIVLSSADENVTVRSTILLVCVAYGGTQTPTITWYRNGSLIGNTTSPRHTVYSSNTTSSGLTFAESILEICSIGLEEGGQYMCEASNGVASTMNTTTLTVMERGEPDRPCNCSSVPVYSEAGALTSIEFNWTKVSNPLMVVEGVNPNVNSYNVSVNGLGAHVVPATSVCADENSQTPCFYSYPMPSFNVPMTSARNEALNGKVAAVNEIGQGRTCSPSLNNIGQMNSFLTISHDPNSGTVTCARGQGLSSEQQFDCNFCYNSGISCLGDMLMTCSQILGGRMTLPALSVGTYCYRATAVVDGRTAAVVQDTFSVRQQGPPLVATLSASITTSFIVAFIIGLLAGCLPCLCYFRRRGKQAPQRVCLNCTHSSSIGTPENKEAALYEAIPLPEKDIAVGTNEAYGRLPEPMW